jgi:hypothetical protein
MQDDSIPLQPTVIWTAEVQPSAGTVVEKDLKPLLLMLRIRAISKMHIY